MLVRRLAKRFSFTPAVLPDLQYDYGDLQPAVSGQIMELHHSKHHQTYVTNFNNAVEDFLAATTAGDVAKAQALHGAIKFNGGGVVNHNLFFENLAPANGQGGVLPAQETALAQDIVANWGSFENFINRFNTKTAPVQGSGWGWLVLDPTTQNLSIITLPDQDTVAQTGLVPLLGVDVWEHAYYLDYQNLRPKYLENIWTVVNWGVVEQRYNAAKN